MSVLGTREVILIHHTDCGMLTFRNDEVKEQVEADVGVGPPFALEAFGDLAPDLRQPVARLRASPFLPQLDRVRAFVYDIETGRLRDAGTTRQE